MLKTLLAALSLASLASRPLPNRFAGKAKRFGKGRPARIIDTMTLLECCPLAMERAYAMVSFRFSHKAKGPKRYWLRYLVAIMNALCR